MVIKGTSPIFTLEELKQIDNLWNYESYTSKDTFTDRLYDSYFTNEGFSTVVINRLVFWFNNLKIQNINNLPENLILHRFYKGCYFDKHTDNQVRNGYERRYLVGVSLNKDYTGGEFLTYNNNKEVIGDIPGVPYMISSTVEHEVTKVKEGIRKSAFIFVFDNHLDEKKSLF